MKNSANISVETRKEWSAPQLKKIDVEQITANGGANNKSDATRTRS